MSSPSEKLVSVHGKGSKRPYRVTIERDEDGWWVATARGAEGVYTQGRTISAARERIVEAMEAAGYSDFTFVEIVAIPVRLRSKVKRAKLARVAAEKAQKAAGEVLREAVRSLTATEGMSLRDAADVLGISFQRVQQLSSGQ